MRTLLPLRPRTLMANQSRRRTGLTLVEMMLSIGLGLMLIGGIYSAIDQSARQFSLGKKEAERLQIARALFRRIELDLRATMFSPESAVSESSSSSSTSTSGSSSSSDSSTTISSSTEDAWTGSLGIRGSATELWIDLSQMSRQLEFVPVNEATVTVASDLKTVAYFLTSADTPVENAEQSPLKRVDPDGVGLARSQGERSALRTLNSNSTEGTLPGPIAVLAPEINQLAFRYFDGLTWYEEWDSSTTGSLPRAVEVTLGFEAPPEAKGYLASSSVSSATNTFRMVISIPVSDPLVAEEDL